MHAPLIIRHSVSDHTSFFSHLPLWCNWLQRIHWCDSYLKTRQALHDLLSRWRMGHRVTEGLWRSHSFTVTSEPGLLFWLSSNNREGTNVKFKVKCMFIGLNAGGWGRKITSPKISLADIVSWKSALATGNPVSQPRNQTTNINKTKHKQTASTFRIQNATSEPLGNSLWFDSILAQRNEGRYSVTDWPLGNCEWQGESVPPTLLGSLVRSLQT